MSEAILDLPDNSVPHQTQHETKEPLNQLKELLEIKGDYYFKLLTFGVAGCAAIDNQNIAQIAFPSGCLLLLLSQKQSDVPLNPQSNL